LLRKNPTNTSGDETAVLVFDYDGTLTLENGTFPTSTKSALKEVYDKKIAMLGIVSGRDISFLKQTNKLVGDLFSFLVAENGAVSYFSDSDQLSIVGREWSQRARATFSKADFQIGFFEIIASSRRENTDRITRILKDSQ
jgi:hydroxymethylpyrimidine pyrophosphatase-like HAD family hydrolase